MRREQGSLVPIREVKARYRADTVYLTEISEQANIACEMLELPVEKEKRERFIFLVQLALSEVFTNIVQHSYKGKLGEIHISFKLFPGEIVIETYDRGEGFVLEEVEIPEAPSLSTGRGYGLYIINRAMDEVTYKNCGAGGNHWRLVKFLPRV